MRQCFTLLRDMTNRQISQLGSTTELLITFILTHMPKGWFSDTNWWHLMNVIAIASDLKLTKLAANEEPDYDGGPPSS